MKKEKMIKNVLAEKIGIKGIIKKIYPSIRVYVVEIDTPRAEFIKSSNRGRGKWQGTVTIGVPKGYTVIAEDVKNIITEIDLTFSLMGLIIDKFSWPYN